MTEYPPDGVSGLQHDTDCWCDKRLHLHAGFSRGTPPVKRGLTVEDILRLCEDEGIEARLVTRVMFFVLKHPEVAKVFGLESKGG